MLRTEVSKEAKISDTMVLLRLFNYQGALTVRYHRQCSFYRRRLFAAYTEVQEHAASMDESATQFINRAINETIERDCQNKETK